jgi:predicted Zn finger-like uncharacterized protein
VIVTCERCSTQFRLDDKRVPEQGVRVRCSRCKYAFRVERPVSSEDERVHRAAARGLEPDTPDVTQDLPDEEEDWEFNDHGPGADAQESDTEEVAVESHTPEPEADEGVAESGADDEGLPLESAGVDAGDASGFVGDVVSQPLETLDGYDNDAPLAPSGLDLDGGSNAFGSGPVAGPFDDAEQDDSESGLDLADPGDSAVGLDPRAPAGGAPEPDVSPSAPEEMSSPDKWDFFAGDGSDGGKAGPRVRMTATPPRARVPRAAAFPREVLSDEPQAHSHWLERAVGSVGWVVVAVAFAAGLYGGFAPEAVDSEAAVASQRVADLRIGDVGGRWIDNLVAGDLYVVSGSLHRDAAGGDTVDGGLVVTLLDAQGERLRLAPIPVGPPLPQPLLRQADPADLHRAGGQAISPRPGSSLRVEAVIPAPPAEARSFRFVAADELAPAAEAGAAATPPSEPEGPPDSPNDAL